MVALQRALGAGEADGGEAVGRGLLELLGRVALEARGVEIDAPAEVLEANGKRGQTTFLIGDRGFQSMAPQEKLSDPVFASRKQP